MEATDLECLRFASRNQRPCRWICFSFLVRARMMSLCQGVYYGISGTHLDCFRSHILYTLSPSDKIHSL